MKIGRMAEDLACDFLLGRGHTILGRNWRSGHLEIDVISLDTAGVHFVEVKARVAPAQAGPEESVGYGKQRKLVAAAKAYLHSEEKKSRLDEHEVFFDIFSVIFEGGKTHVKYFPQAYLPLNT
jgi:putative endonuclease